MRIDHTTLLLFTPFPRDVGNPSKWIVDKTPARRVVYNLREFSKFIDENNGIRNCYASIYPLDGTIDKISFDFDGTRAISDAKLIYQYLIDEKFSVIPVISGKKGIHLHVLLEPRIYGEDAKTLLLNASYNILQNALKGKDISSADPHRLGDIRSLFRIPNTLRPPENISWCTYLPPDFINMSEEEIIIYSKSPHIIEYKNIFRNRTLYDFEKVDMNFEKWLPVGKYTPIVPQSNEFLKRILRPCLYRHIIEKNPTHSVRVASTIDLLVEGLQPEEIAMIYERLGWLDYDASYTRYQIQSIASKGYIPYPCKTLRRLGIPSVCCVG